MRVRALRFDAKGPADTTPLAQALAEGDLHAEDLRCVIGKTEGNGGRNDFTRELAVRAYAELLAAHLGVAPGVVEDRVVLSFSGGTEGVVTPHSVVFAVEGELPPEPRPEKRLALGVGFTREFSAHEIGRMAQIDETARAIAEIAARIRVAPEDIHLVQMKGAIPPFTYDDATAARRAGQPLRSDMVYSRAASALGAAVATGEVPRAALDDAVVCEDFSLYSGTASTSAKPGLMRTELVVFGQSAFWEGELAIDHGVMKDILDAETVRDVARRLGATPDRLVATFAKSEADPRGTVRGHRHTMLTDDDVGDTRYSRCVLSSVLAATLGDTRVYVSTRAEHHGPLGGGPVALIARVE